MRKVRGGVHSTLTETATEVVKVLNSIPGVTMIAPGIIKSNTKASGKRFVTGVFTNAGMELIVTGQSTQKISVHCIPAHAPFIFEALRTHKKLAHMTFKSRFRQPGI